MHNKVALETISHSSTPSAMGRQPIFPMAFRLSPDPIRNRVTANPDFATWVMAVQAGLALGHSTLSHAATRNSSTNQGHSTRVRVRDQIAVAIATGTIHSVR